MALILFRNLSLSFPLYISTYFLTQICIYALIQYEELGVNMNKTEKIPVFTEHLVGKMDYKQTKI